MKVMVIHCGVIVAIQMNCKSRDNFGFFNQIYTMFTYVFFRVLRQTLVEFACRVETKDCINRATNLWYQAFDSLQSGNANHT